MNILLPYWNLTDFYYYRYRNQFKAIAENVDNLYILYNNGNRVDTEGNITYIKLKRKYALKFWQRRLKFPLISYYKTKEMIKHIPRFDYDALLMYSGGAVNQYMSYLIAKELEIPYCIRLRGNAKREREYFVKSWIRRKVYDYYDHKVLSEADLIIPITQKFKDEILLGRSKNVGEVIPIGVDTNVFNLTPLPDEITLGYFGRISKEKGSEFLLKLMLETPEINYIVAGAKYYNIDFPENCAYHGVIRHSNIAPLYNKCSMILLPSIIEEGLSNTILESYSKGRPILCSKNAIPNEVEHYGYYEDLDIDTWVNIIINLKKGALRIMGLSARKYIEKYFSWDKFGKGIIEEISKGFIVKKTSWSKEGKVDYLDRIWQQPEEIPEYREMMIEEITKILNNHREYTLLDAGCGTGLLYHYLPEMFKANYVGIDFTPEMVEYCREKYPYGKFENVDIKDSKLVPYADIIVTQNVIQHNDFWQIVLANLIDKARNVVIFCERTHDEHTVKVGEDPPRWRFNYEDFKNLMEFIGKGLFDRPEIVGHPKSTEGLEQALTIFKMSKRK